METRSQCSQVLQRFSIFAIILTSQLNMITVLRMDHDPVRIMPDEQDPGIFSLTYKLTENILSLAGCYIFDFPCSSGSGHFYDLHLNIKMNVC